MCRWLAGPEPWDDAAVERGQRAGCPPLMMFECLGTEDAKGGNSAHCVLCEPLGEESNC